MSDTALIAALAVLGTLVGVVIVGGAALCAALFVRERLGRRHAEALAAGLTAELREAKADLALYRRQQGNKLFHRSMRDISFATQQALLRAKAERDRTKEEWDVLVQILETGKKGLEQ